MRSAIFALSALLLPRSSSGSQWVQKKCAGEMCSDPKFPILDYDGDTCVCRSHPCWNDKGVSHSCNTNDENPFIAFAYLSNGSLVCSCQKHAHHGSVYLAEDICPGAGCNDPEFPILEYDEDKQNCVCSASPCLNDNGMKHECVEADYPILTFSYEKGEKLKCGCSKKFDAPTEKEL